ncbi:hypothetical protein EJ05DRAFT_316384 [Pseudovirgaria hyperparasitica]|uniref:Uncharacterized protein n=1 Tax=Pseudovirgaria hyperparasitica TaxID=470096 RepID=A0A6A6WDL2_9PEZI|nr:uncharacterized protein EJ05DRAFT_316384 [Pseudovirgaria hyperparasitica]KAF2759946.1 hypothetical protein EJ05DRAFT_316384 [Pseudovirgaria hyperparasitica]
MAGPPPPWTWRADTGFLPPANIWLAGEPVVTAFPGMYGPAPNPNVFFDMGDGPPGPIAPMQFSLPFAGAPVFASGPSFVPVQATPIFGPPMQSIPAMVCAMHQCPCEQCGCYGPGQTYNNWRPGINLLPPPQSTTIHVYWDLDAAWGETASTSRSTVFHTFDVDASWTVDTLLQSLMRSRNSTLKRGPVDPKGWALTEYTEKGGGTFCKGSTFIAGDKKAGNTLSKIGWTEKRGHGGLPPVTCQLHMAPKEDN